MPIFSLAVRTTAGATGAAAWELRTGANTRARLMEFGLFMAAATASTYGIGKPAAIGITPTSPVDVLQEDPADIQVAALVQSALAWGTGPTVPVNFFRRWSGPATIGTGMVWTFPRGLVIAASSSLVLWNLATNGVVDAHAVFEY